MKRIECPNPCTLHQWMYFTPQKTDRKCMQCGRTESKRRKNGSKTKYYWSVEGYFEYISESQ